MNEISKQLEDDLLRLYPRAFGDRALVPRLIEQLINSERWRNGAPEATGAFHVYALTQGTLFKEEYDLSTHGHAEGWTVGAIVVDPIEMTRFNMAYGFEAGDVALRAMVEAMRTVCPRAKIVHIHGDGFAVLLGPTSDSVLEASLGPRMREALLTAMPKVTPGTEFVLDFTVGLLSLTVVDPPNWQILGPLVWAECERAIVIARRAPSMDIMQRLVRLDGRLPEGL